MVALMVGMRAAQMDASLVEWRVMRLVHWRVDQMVRPTVVMMGVYLVAWTVDYLVVQSVAELESRMAYLWVILSELMMGQQMVCRWDNYLVGKWAFQKVGWSELVTVE